MRAERIFSTPFGHLAAAAEGNMLVAVQTAEAVALPPSTNQTSPALDLFGIQLREYLAGDRTFFSVPVKFSGTPFQQDVWNALLEIPYGKTISYAELAKTVGNASAVRAVAAANARNRLLVVVPCHRVIGANGSLTGYAGGLELKRSLILHEHSHVASRPGSTPALF